MRLKLIIIFLCSSIFGTEKFIGEVLKYQAGFRFFSAGEAIISFDWDTLVGDSVYFINADIKTNSFLDRFYRIRDNIKTWINPLDFSLKKVEKNISEGKYKKKHRAEIDYLSNIISYDNKKLNIQSIVFDPLSIIYKLRTNFNIQHFPKEVTIYDMGKIKNVLFKIEQIEKIKVPFGEFECLIISPYSTNSKKILKNNGQMKVWFTNDKKMIPIKIEQITNIGTMVMELKEYIP